MHVTLRNAVHRLAVRLVDEAGDFPAVDGLVLQEGLCHRVEARPVLGERQVRFLLGASEYALISSSTTRLVSSE